MTNTIKNATLPLEEGDSTMTKKEFAKDELKEFANSDKIYTIKEIREYSGLSQAGFAAKYDIPKRSIENWEGGKRECPLYVTKLLNRVVKDDIKHDLRYSKKEL